MKYTDKNSKSFHFKFGTSVVRLWVSFGLFCNHVRLFVFHLQAVNSRGGGLIFFIQDDNRLFRTIQAVLK